MGWKKITNWKRPFVLSTLYLDPKVKWVMYVEGISEIRVSDVSVGTYKRQTEHKHAAGRTVLKCDVFQCEA